MTAMLVLYSRPGCHLCEDMERALEPLLRSIPASLEVIDVDSDPKLRSRYGLRVPVLALDGHIVCEARLDADAVRDALGAR